MQIGHIKQSLKVLGITQTEAAEHLSIPVSTLNAILNGTSQAINQSDEFRLRLELVKFVKERAAQKRSDLAALFDSLGVCHEAA